MKIITDFRTRPPKPFKRAGRPCYYIRQTVGGKEAWRSLHTENRRDAEALAYRIWFSQQSELVKGSILTAPKTTFAMAWDAHTATEKFRLLTDSTRRTRESRWNTFKKWAESNRFMNVESIDKNAAALYLATFEGKAKTTNNVRSDLAAILPAFAETEQRSITRGETASDVVRSFDDDEINRILDYLSSPGCNMAHASGWRMAVLVALGTGLRYKDVCLLKWESIHDGVLEVVPAKTARLGKSVLMKLPPLLSTELDALPKTSEFVLADMAERHNDINSGNPFQQMLKRLGIKSDSRGRAGFHSLRVVFATKARQAGVSSELLGGILGHGNKEQTEHYNRSSDTVDLSAVEWR